MKKLQLAALLFEALTLVVNSAAAFLPDWTVRLNGVIMLASAAVLVFASVRLTQITRKER